MTKSLLPHYWKKIAQLLFLITIALWILDAALADVVSLDPITVKWILKMLILGSLLILALSREKLETEKMAKLRINNGLVSLGAGIGYLLFQDAIAVLYMGSGSETTSGYELLLVMLSVYVFRFYIKKNIRVVAAD